MSIIQLSVKLIITSVHPFLFMTALCVRFDQTSELAVDNAPSGPIALRLSDFKYYLNSLRIKGVNIDPDALVKHVVQGLQRILVPLFFCQPILLAPVALRGSVRVFLHGSRTHSQLRRVMRVPSQFLFSQSCIEPRETIEKRRSVWREIFVLATLGLADSQTHQETLRSQADEKFQQLLLQSSRRFTSGRQRIQFFEYITDQGCQFVN